jgi:hypothetical protein
VFLSKEDRKSVNALKPIEKVLGYATALFAAVTMFTIVVLSEQGFEGANLWRLPLGIAFAALLAALAKFTNRWLAGIGAIAVVYGGPWGRGFIFATPVLAYFVWVNLRVYRDNKSMLATRMAEGNYGVDPRSAAARDRKGKKDVRATEDASGRVLAPASKRYTPPKAAKKR